MQALLRRIGPAASIDTVGNGIAEYEIELAPKGLGRQLEEALRAAAAGHLQLPPRLCETLRGLVPLHPRDRARPSGNARASASARLRSVAGGKLR